MPPFQGHSILFLTPPRHVVSVVVPKSIEHLNHPPWKYFIDTKERGTQFSSWTNERPSEGDRKCYCTLMTPSFSELRRKSRRRKVQPARNAIYDYATVTEIGTTTHLRERFNDVDCAGKTLLGNGWIIKCSSFPFKLISTLCESVGRKK